MLLDAIINPCPNFNVGFAWPPLTYGMVLMSGYVIVLSTFNGLSIPLVRNWFSEFKFSKRISGKFPRYQNIYCQLQARGAPQFQQYVSHTVWHLPSLIHILLIRVRNILCFGRKLELLVGQIYICIYSVICYAHTWLQRLNIWFSSNMQKTVFLSSLVLPILAGDASPWSEQICIWTFLAMSLVGDEPPTAP